MPPKKPLLQSSLPTSKQYKTLPLPKQSSNKPQRSSWPLQRLLQTRRQQNK